MDTKQAGSRWTVVRRLFWLALIVTLGLGGWMGSADKALVTDVAPRGVVSLEFASTAREARNILIAWDHLDGAKPARAIALRQIHIDYLFIPAYVATLVLGCLLVRAGWRKSRSVLGERVGSVILWLQPVAGILDVVENRLMETYFSAAGPTDVATRVASICAEIKFLLIGAGILYLLTYFRRWLGLPFWRKVGEVVLDVGAVCWRCVFPLVLLFLGLAIFGWSDQGLDVLKAIDQGPARVQPEVTMHTPTGAWFALFAISSLAWAFATWFSARAVLSRKYGASKGALKLNTSRVERDTKVSRFLIEWAPRSLGLGVYAVLMLGMWRANANWQNVIVVAVLAVVYWVVVVYRRRFFKQQIKRQLKRDGFNPRAQEAFVQTPALTSAALRWTVIFLLLSFALLVAVLFWPVTVPRLIGPAGIVMFAFASWAIFGSIVLVHLPKTHGLPSLALLPLIVGLVFGPFNDNHRVRSLPAPAVGTPPDVCAGASCIEATYKAWAASRRTPVRAGKEYPLFFVAAEGGGLRAAYWTASVLAEIEAASGNRFSDHLFAISGVSGGSVGAGVFASLIRERERESADPADWSAAPACAGSGFNGAAHLTRCVQAVLGQDHLSPTLAGMLYPDLIQRFLPAPFEAFDRSRFLEGSWEHAWRQAITGSLHLDDALTALTPNASPRCERSAASSGSKSSTPNLILNGTSVETGQPILATTLCLGDDDMPGATELARMGAHAWPLQISSAMHLSARFPYVSPVGTLYKKGKRKVLDRVGDGGYFENLGLDTLLGVIHALEPHLPSNVKPYVIVITNNPGELGQVAGASPSCKELATPKPKKPSTAMVEIASPVRTLMNTRQARAVRALHVLRAELPAKQRFEFGLPLQEEDPSLGWYLSAVSHEAMHCQLFPDDGKSAARKQIGNIARLIGKT